MGFSLLSLYFFFFYIIFANPDVGKNKKNIHPAGGAVFFFVLSMAGRDQVMYFNKYYVIRLNRMDDENKSIEDEGHWCRGDADKQTNQRSREIQKDFFIVFLKTREKMIITSLINLL